MGQEAFAPLRNRVSLGSPRWSTPQPASWCWLSCPLLSLSCGPGVLTPSFLGPGFPHSRALGNQSKHLGVSQENACQRVQKGLTMQAGPRFAGVCSRDPAPPRRTGGGIPGRGVSGWDLVETSVEMCPFPHGYVRDHPLPHRGAADVTAALTGHMHKLRGGLETAQRLAVGDTRDF